MIARVNAEVTKAIATPKMRKRLDASGLEVVTMAPEAFAAFVRDEVVRWRKLVDELGLRKKVSTPVCRARRQAGAPRGLVNRPEERRFYVTH